MCTVGMCDSHCATHHSINYASDAIALFEQQRSQSEQPFELKDDARALISVEHFPQMKDFYFFN